MLFRSVKIFVKLDLHSSDRVSFVPTWRRMLVMVDGREDKTSGSFMRISFVVAPGKQCVLALINWTFFVIESPMMTMVGLNRGSGRGSGARDGWTESVVVLSSVGGGGQQQWTAKVSQPPVHSPLEHKTPEGLGVWCYCPTWGVEGQQQ